MAQIKVVRVRATPPSGETPHGPLIKTSLNPSLGNISFDMSDGQSKKFACFDIWTDETDVGGADTVVKEITATLDFDSPDSSAVFTGGTVGIEGVLLFGQIGRLFWDGPAIVETATGTFKVTLSDELFNFWLFGLSEGWCYGATVKAEVCQISTTGNDSHVVPLLGVAAGGLIMFGVMLAQRTREARQAA